jgi:hypothetical protein
MMAAGGLVLWLLPIPFTNSLAFWLMTAAYSFLCYAAFFKKI